MVYDIVIIGSGPAGLTAAIYAARKKLKVIILESELVGGWLAKVHAIENYPGYVSIPGPDLAKKMEEQVKKLSVEIKYETVTSIAKEKNIFAVKCSSNKSYEGKTVILATGASAKKLGIAGEDKFLNKGVSYCYLCDGPLYCDKTVAVIGGGDAAAKAAIMLAGIAKKVYVIHRRDEFRAEEILIEQMKKKKNVECVMCCVPVEVKGGKLVEKLVVKSTSDEKLRELSVDGVFIEVGNTPAAVLAQSVGAELTDKGYIKVNKSQETNVPGLLAAGDVTDFPLKQIVSAVGQGAQATVAAAAHLIRQDQ